MSLTTTTTRGTITRTTWHSPKLDELSPVALDPETYDWTEDERREATEEEANLVSSLTANGLHAPVLDLDYPCRLVPSRTPGHFHLYLDVEITWTRYMLALWGLSAAGLIEGGFFRAAMRRGATFARWRYTPPRSADYDPAREPF